jgi:hypothetical protein
MCCVCGLGILAFTTCYLQYLAVQHQVLRVKLDHALCTCRALPVQTIINETAVAAQRIAELGRRSFTVRTTEASEPDITPACTNPILFFSLVGLLPGLVLFSRWSAFYLDTCFFLAGQPFTWTRASFSLVSLLPGNYFSAPRWITCPSKNTSLRFMIHLHSQAIFFSG